jgi:SAM-dependent methyltransferase
MTSKLSSVYPSASYDESYAHYLAYLGFSDKLASESAGLTAELPKWIGNSPTHSILDIGAGTGRLARTIHDMFGDCGRPFSMTLLEPASTAVQELHIQFGADKRVEICHADLQSFINDNCQARYSLVLASQVAYYFKDRVNFLRTIYSLVAPSGVLCCIVGSGSLFHHSLYTEVLREIFKTHPIKRSFGMDGYGACAEEIELIGFNEGLLFQSTDVPARLLFTPDQIHEGAKALEHIETSYLNHLCISLGFLFRIPISTIFASRHLVLEYFQVHDSYIYGIDIPCHERILFLRR